MLILFRRLHRLFRLLPPFILRDLREQYAGSALGTVWSIIQPALLILLYWWVFSQILRIRVPLPPEVTEDVPFIAFLLSGLLPWFAFQDGITKGASAIVARRDVVKKVYFPVHIFPLATTAAAFVSNAIGFILFLTVFFIWKGGVALHLLLAIITIFFLQATVAAGLSLFLAALTVYIRDVAQLIGLLFMAMFYTTPILYPLAMVPEWLQAAIFWNPFTAFVESYHYIVLWGQWPSLGMLTGLSIFALGSALAGTLVYKQLEPGFADVL